MDEIRFLPVCSNCNRIIYETVDFSPPDLSYFENNRKYIAEIPRYISPNSCPYCGERFNKILIPTELPFTDDNYNKAITISKFGEEHDR